MTTTTNMHVGQSIRAGRLDSGAVYVEIRDGGGNTVNVFIPGRAFAEALARATRDALELLTAGGPS